MLAVPGLWYVHEPFNPNKHIWNESFTYANPDSQRPDIDKYVQQLLDGRRRETASVGNCDHPLMPLRLFRPSIRRIMIKDPVACLLTGYLTARFAFQGIVPPAVDLRERRLVL
jgi:hypothetical protein